MIINSIFVWTCISASAGMTFFVLYPTFFPLSFRFQVRIDFLTFVNITCFLELSVCVCVWGGGLFNG